MQSATAAFEARHPSLSFFFCISGHLQATLSGTRVAVALSIINPPMRVCITRRRELRGPSGINQPRKTCRKVLTSRGNRRGGRGELFASERVKPAPLSRVPETPRGPGGIFLSRLILPDAADPPAILPLARRRAMWAKKEDKGCGEDGEDAAGGPYRRSRMTRQANCVISVQRTPPPPPRLSSCRPFSVLCTRVCFLDGAAAAAARCCCCRCSCSCSCSRRREQRDFARCHVPRNLSS